MKEVSKQEFDEFLNNYPNILERTLDTMRSPPIATWTDAKKSVKWTDSIVCVQVLGLNSFDFYIIEDL